MLLKHWELAYFSERDLEGGPRNLGVEVGGSQGEVRGKSGGSQGVGLGAGVATDTAAAATADDAPTSSGRVTSCSEFRQRA